MKRHFESLEVYRKTLITKMCVGRTAEDIELMARLLDDCIVTARLIGKEDAYEKWKHERRLKCKEALDERNAAIGLNR